MLFGIEDWLVIVVKPIAVNGRQLGGFCGFVTGQDYFESRGKAGGKVEQVVISACYSPSALTWFGVGKSSRMTIQRHYGLGACLCSLLGLRITV